MKIEVIVKLKSRLHKFISSNQMLDRVITYLEPKIQLLIERWVRFSLREKQLIITLVGVLGLFVIFSIITSAVDFSDGLEKENRAMQVYKLDVKSLQKEYKQLSQLTVNEFSDVSLSRVREDVKQALKVKDTDVVLQDNVLVIKADSVSFESVVLLLEELRKNYGIFPNKLKITQSNPSYVNFSANFLVSQ